MFAGCGDGSGSSSNSGNGGNGGNNGNGNNAVVYDDTTALCFNSSGSNTVSIKIEGTLGTIPELEFSKDGQNWTPIVLVDGGTVEVTALSNREKVYLRAQNTNNSFSESVFKYIQFVFTGDGTIAASGNIMSLLDKTLNSTEIPCDYCFYDLFKNCASLTRAPVLPATTLTSHCYHSMFKGCTKLVAAPVLPALTMKSQCYDSMFMGCTSLKTAPDLLAEALDSGCYLSMFSDCTSLKTAPDLLAESLTFLCYSEMFKGCISLETAPNLPATLLDISCYSSMFEGCTKLVVAPVLPALTMKSQCYFSMFSGCTSLKTAPDLLAESLVYGCYGGMFNGCTSLNYLKVFFTDWAEGIDATLDWVNGVTSLVGTFYHKAGLNVSTKDATHVPVNFSTQTF